ncbi:MAG: hypothetical protein RL885_21215 [Planctomycetota bacterium]
MNAPNDELRIRLERLARACEPDGAELERIEETLMNAHQRYRARWIKKPVIAAAILLLIASVGAGATIALSEWWYEVRDYDEKQKIVIFHQGDEEPELGILIDEDEVEHALDVLENGGKLLTLPPQDDE